LWAAGDAGLRAVHAAASAYRSHVRLEQAELTRLSDVIATRPVILACWEFATGSRGLAETLDRLTRIRTDAEKIATRALAVLVAP
jgi:hypothetical protein